MITVTGLKKDYGAVQALKGVSFDILAGELFGLLGPNGAGKTTTISILSTLLRPDAGSVTLAGLDLEKNPESGKKNIGVVPQEIALYNELTAYANLVFWGSLYNVPGAELKARIDQTLKQVGLFDRRNDKVKTYSGGMKRRINIAAALLHRPKILFMDEPTVGIDPQSRNLIFEVVENLHKEGMTIVYTTHYMEEAERLCDRIAIIDNGSIVGQGTLDELKHSIQTKETIVVAIANMADDLEGRVLVEWPGSKRVGDAFHFYTANAKNDLSRIILKCSALGLDVVHIEVQKVNLETVFLSLTGKQLRD
jgi:ABC-2 type transport system ATP-binding protein